MPIIKLNAIETRKNRVDFSYTVSEEIKKYFSSDLNFFYEYPEQYDLSKVPESILVVPFVMNMMPLVWISNTELVVNRLDDSFYNSLQDVLAGFRRVHPDVAFGGKLTVKQLEKNEYEADDTKKALLFSGGVDAVSTLVTHIDEKPMLINVWGADVHPNDMENHKVIERDLTQFSEELELPFFFIRSSLRWCFDEPYLSEYYKNTIHDTWWHGMQHGVGLLSLLAPYDYLEKVSTNYIASSYTEQDIGTVRCISYPFVDSVLKMGTTQCFHDGFEKHRIDKIENIVTFAARSEGSVTIPLKVCFHPRNGENCCKCEKCLRTIAAILTMGENLSQFGFTPDYSNAEDYVKRFCNRNILAEDVITFWAEIREFVKKNGTSNPKMEWIADYKFNTFRSKWYTPLETQIRIRLGKIRHALFVMRKK